MGRAGLEAFTAQAPSWGAGAWGVTAGWMWFPVGDEKLRKERRKRPHNIGGVLNALKMG